ncbi:MAG TPA: nucleotidyltransferase [Eggerthellaceae bacterium]|nr:nucleotidyltransferase [Eggerthellaceae bacterium]
MRRYDQYERTLKVLSRADEQDLSNEFVQSGVIDKFSLQFELGWKTLKGLLCYEGDASAATGSPRDVLKSAYRCFGFIDEDVWLAMLQDRNTITHLYDEGAVLALLGRILDGYIPAFQQLRDAIETRYGETLRLID